MGIKDAQIQLDNVWATYYPGQTIRGKVEFTFDKPKEVRGIYVAFKGEAHTSWSEKHSQRDSQGQSREVTMPYSGSEEYFFNKYYLIGSKNGKEIELNAGTQSYMLEATLPPSLPSSFEGEFGYIRYTITVTLDRPWKFDQETKMAFTVISPLDLNLNPSYRTPLHIQIEKIMCCCCCASAPLSVDVRAPVTGYVPGQSIPLQIMADNQSNAQLHLVKLQLRKIVKYRVTTPDHKSKTTTDVVAETSEGPVPAGERREWSVGLDIPSLPPSNLVGCGLIDLDYDFRVECVISGWHKNKSSKCNVTIGSVPLVVVGASGQPVGPVPAPAPVPTPSAPYEDDPNAVVPTASDNGTTPTGPGWIPQPPPHQSLYPSLAAPAYQESQFKALNIQNDQYTSVVGRLDFAPLYPVYNMPVPQ